MTSFVLHLIYIGYNTIRYVNPYHIRFGFIDPHYFESIFGSNNIVVYVYGATEDTDYNSSMGSQCLKIIIRFPPESGYWNYGIWNFYATEIIIMEFDISYNNVNIASLIYERCISILDPRTLFDTNSCIGKSIYLWLPLKLNVRASCLYFWSAWQDLIIPIYLSGSKESS